MDRQITVSFSIKKNLYNDFLKCVKEEGIGSTSFWISKAIQDFVKNNNKEKEQHKQ